MDEDSFARIEKILKETPSLALEKRAELLGLLGDLRREMKALDATHPGVAETIADRARDAAAQAARPARDQESLGRALSNLSSSVQGFEQSHPRLVHAANTICNALANMGI